MKKKLILTMAVVMMLSVVLASGAFAASDSVTGTIPGTAYTCRGYAYCYDWGGRAEVYFSGPTAAGLDLTLEYSFRAPLNDATITSHKYKTGFSTSTELEKPESFYLSVKSRGLYHVDYAGTYWADYATADY